MTIAGDYDRWAASYDADRNLTRDLDATVLRRTHEAIRVGTIIEAGCGTGKNSGFFASIAAEVVALDLSPAMLAVARAKHSSEHIRFVEHDIRSAWPVPVSSADLVSFSLVLEHIAQLEPVFAHAAAALRDGGRVYVSELHPYRQYRGSQARFVATDGTEVRVQAFTHHISDFIRAADGYGLQLDTLAEWWHDADDGAEPRLLTMQFVKRLA